MRTAGSSDGTATGLVSFSLPKPLKRALQDAGCDSVEKLAAATTRSCSPSTAEARPRCCLNVILLHAGHPGDTACRDVASRLHVAGPDLDEHPVLHQVSGARRMLKQRSGVIMTRSGTPGRQGSPLIGGFGAASEAVEALIWPLAAELGADGIRVMCLRTTGTLPADDPWLDLHAKQAGVTPEELVALVTSDFASPMIGTIVNMTCGMVVDYRKE